MFLATIAAHLKTLSEGLWTVQYRNDRCLLQRVLELETDNTILDLILVELLEWLCQGEMVGNDAVLVRFEFAVEFLTSTCIGLACQSGLAKSFDVVAINS